MKLKEYIFIIICFVAFCMALLGGDTLTSVIGVCGIYLCFIIGFMYHVLRWTKNKNQINGEYISVNIENVIFEVFMLFVIYSDIKHEYETRVFDLKFIYNKTVKINNFKDFLNTYDEIEKIMLYMMMGFIVGVILLIVKKIICRGRISSEQILFSNGEIIKIKDIKYIKVEDTLWTFSKKITITIASETNNRVIYINNKLFSKVEKDLYNIIANSNSV